ncbi:hypothetical protein [Myxosarcina sp. GI1(2024)]
MAKRRNAKKEKAARNKMNARKFHKPSARYYGKSKRRSNYNNDSNEQKSSETESKKSSSSEQNTK